MRITIEHEDATIMLDEPIVLAADSLNACVRALISVGFHGDSIREAVIEMGEELDRDRQNDGAC